MTEESQIAADIPLKYLISDTDRHGNVRYYLRVPGKKKVRLYGEPSSEEFLAEYRRHRFGAEKPTVVKAPEPPRDRNRKVDWLKAGKNSTFTHLRNAYVEESLEYGNLGEKTQADRKNALDRFCTNNGDRRVTGLTVGKLEQFMDQWAKNGPDAANGMLKTLRAALRYAMRRKVVTENVAEQVAYIETKSEGFHTWTVGQIEQYVQTHKVGTMAHLTIAIGLFAGLRRSDIVLVGRQHLRGGRLKMKPTKTKKTSGVEVDIPILPELQYAIDNTPSAGDLTLIISERGGPYTAKSFGNRFKKWCQEAGLPDECTLHGLRKAGATLAAENGATEHQLMAIYGWTTTKEAMRYTAKARRRRLSDAGIGALSLEYAESTSVPLFKG